MNIQYVQQGNSKYLVNFSNSAREYISLNSKFLSSGFSSSTQDIKRDATPDEIVWFNLCIKANKYIDKPVEHLYKKGDYIVCLNYIRNKNGKENYCYKLINNQEKLNDNLMYQAHAGIGMPEHQVRYATLDEIRRYDAKGVPYDVTSKDTILSTIMPEYIKIKEGGWASSHSTKSYIKAGYIYKVVERAQGPYGTIYICQQDDFAGYASSCVTVTFEDYKQQMMQIAQAKFPVGTKYRSPYSGDTFTIDSNRFNVDSDGSISNSGNFVFHGGKWAEITSELEHPLQKLEKDSLIAEAKRKYPSGTIINGEGTIIWENMSSYGYESPHIDAADGDLYLGLDEHKGGIRVKVYDGTTKRWPNLRAKLQSSNNYSLLSTDWCIRGGTNFSRFISSKARISGANDSFYYYPIGDITDLSTHEHWNYLDQVPIGRTEITFDQLLEINSKKSVASVVGHTINNLYETTSYYKGKDLEFQEPVVMSRPKKTKKFKLVVIN